MLWLRGLVSPVAFGLGLGAWGLGVEPGRLIVRPATLASRLWPGTMAPIRIAVISDLHVGAPHVGLAKVEQVVNRVNRLKADLVVLLGDYVVRNVLFGKFVPPRPIMQRLGRLKARLGVLAVLGNHDWWYDGPAVRRALEQAGITVLENQTVCLDTADGRFWIGGLADRTTRQVDIEGTLEGVPDHEPVIMLSHDPAVFPQIPDTVPLTLAGHTHGGQVKVGPLSPPVHSDGHTYDHLHGWIHQGTKSMFVTAGIGTSVVPMRLNVPPEIALITLRSR
jgi:uncharacterized protein